MTSNGGVSQRDPTSSGTPLTLTLPGAISACSREYAVATFSQVRNLLGWHGATEVGRMGPTTKMLIVRSSISSSVAVVGTKPKLRNVAVEGGNWCSPWNSSRAAL